VRAASSGPASSVLHGSTGRVPSRRRPRRCTRKPLSSDSSTSAGATERTGVDVWSKSFAAEFRADDDVPASSDFSTTSASMVRGGSRTRRDRGPRRSCIARGRSAIAGYSTGRRSCPFPFRRGEAFALPSRSASHRKRRSRHTRYRAADLMYCTPSKRGSSFILAHPRTSDGKRPISSPTDALSAAHARCYERRDRARTNSGCIRRSVAGFTWSVGGAAGRGQRDVSEIAIRSRPRSVVSPGVHILRYGHVGRTRWKKVAATSIRALHSRFETRRAHLQDAFFRLSPRVLVAQSASRSSTFVAAYSAHAPRPRFLVRGPRAVAPVLQS